MRSTLVLETLYELLLSLIIDTKIVQKSLAESISIVSFKLILISDKSEDLNAFVKLECDSLIIHSFHFNSKELVNVLSHNDRYSVLPVDEVFKSSFNGEGDFVVLVAGFFHYVAVLATHVDESVNHVFFFLGLQKFFVCDDLKSSFFDLAN